MIRFVFYAFIFLAGLCAGCRNNTTANSATAAIQSRQDSVLAEPDATDLLQVLQGKWQSEQDSTYRMEINGNKMKHFSGGKFLGETEIEIDGNCLGVACKIDSIETANGWCFTEKGQYDIQCNLVLKCDKQALQYQALGAASPALSFKKQ